MNYIGYVQVNSLGIQTLNKKEILYSGVYCDIPSTEKKGGEGSIWEDTNQFPTPALIFFGSPVF